MEIEGRVAVVSGGASGLGLATARALLARGARVGILDLATSAGEKVVAELGESAAFFPADVTREADVERAVHGTRERFGALHIDINCAGIGWAQRTVTREGSHPLAPFQNVIEVNLFGTFQVARIAAERMAHNEPGPDGERGVIVNTASVAAFDGQIGQVAYAASKGGIVGMTLPMARDLAGLGIRVCTIAPGLFNTPLLAGLPEPAREALAANIPFPHRLGEPDEYGLLACQIVENPMLNGETIRLDGALRMPPR